ncbi:MAG: AAA family ATPase, partial [Okeania sp. SIO3C4]|nr:AAA family ATPase [Okeania sp. SIO3C4]
FEFEQPNILLIEEPEIHLHPALEISMMRYLKRITPKGTHNITDLKANKNVSIQLLTISSQLL